MKGIAKLAFFFSSCFILVFLLAAAVQFLDLWIEAVRVIPVQIDYIKNLSTALAWAVPVSLYISMLLSHTYAARKKVKALPSMLVVMALSVLFTLGAFLSMEQYQKFDLGQVSTPAIGGQPGLILSRRDTSIVLLTDYGTYGPRVVSFPGEELIYQGENWGPINTALAPALPFGDHTPWFLHSIFLDFGLSARELDMRFKNAKNPQDEAQPDDETGQANIEETQADDEEAQPGNILTSALGFLGRIQLPATGYMPFLLYMGALILFLGSFRIILGLSSWPLANLFLGILMFRGILSLEGFVNTPETQALISEFLGEWLPADLVTPFVFAGLGIFIIFFSSLTYLAWGKRRGND